MIFAVGPGKLQQLLHHRACFLLPSFAVQQRLADLSDVVEEAVGGIQVVKAYGQEHQEEERLELERQGLTIAEEVCTLDLGQITGAIGGWPAAVNRSLYRAVGTWPLLATIRWVAAPVSWADDNAKEALAALFARSTASTTATPMVIPARARKACQR